ncbi:glycosyltransferase [Sphingomonas sp. PR090111-T3T-6A]|uniref:glycosyltransferase n=1 Tax=Sphingomonas sp. PR090111-T3T-6A TaxID=685778 RepID=UPI00036B2ABF|nr:glycosyltransferase [Sphingomonas sp. PR090111-T3T-6A]
MKLLHVITGLNVGGAETMLARLLESRNLAPDICPEVLSLMTPGVAGDRIAATGTPVWSLGMPSGLPSPGAMARLVATTRRVRPDLIMGWMHHGQLAASLGALAVPGPVPVIWNVRHSLSGYRQEKRLSRMVLRMGAWLSGMPSAIVYNSRTARAQYRAFGYRARRDLVIPNGFDAQGFTSREPARRALHALFALPERAVLIGMIARNHPMKDVPNLLAAFAKVQEGRPDTHLLIAGEGIDAPSGDAAAWLDRLPPGSWTLTGHRADVPTWLAGLDVVALPSAWGEGFPNIVGEAMAAGVPCVATDVGDAAWVVGETGRAVPPRDAGALAKALLDLAELGPEGRAALGHAARGRVEEHFSLSRVMQRYAALFREHGGKASPLLPAAAWAEGAR